MILIDSLIERSNTDHADNKKDMMDIFFIGC